MESSLGFVQGTCEVIQTLVLVTSREARQVTVEDFDDELGNVGSLTLALIWSFD